MNKIRNKFLLMIILISLILVSGCINQKPATNVYANNGLLITDFHTEPPENEIISGEPLQVFLEVENVGGTRAINVIGELQGAFFDRLFAWLDPVTGLGTTISPPDPVTKSPGGTKSMIFSLIAPQVPEGLASSYPLKVRVTYDYKTTAAATFYAYSKNRYSRDLQRGLISAVIKDSAIPIEHSIDPTPIRITITGPDKMIVYNNPYEEYVYHITFTNVGEGVPITLGVDGLISGFIWIEGPTYWGTNYLPSVYLKDCLGIPTSLFTGLGQNSATYSYFSTRWTDPTTRQAAYSSFVNYPYVIGLSDFQQYGIKLRRGQSVTKSCTIAVNNPIISPSFAYPWTTLPQAAVTDWSTRETGTIKMYFDLDYRYYIERDNIITVTGPVRK